jgi:hypothetical protein
MRKKIDSITENQTIVHGECFLFPKEIPASAKKLTINANHMIVAPSETTGNHHVVDVMEGVEFFQEGETLYMSSTVPTQIRCVMESRHDTIGIPAGMYEFGSQQEYDPFTARLQKVRD